MEAHAGQIAEKLEESESAGTSAVLAPDDTHESAGKAVRELQRSEIASNVTVFGKTVKVQDVVNEITPLMRSSQPVLDICDQRFFCRMAKKLGCQFCAEK